MGTKEGGKRAKVYLMEGEGSDSEYARNAVLERRRVFAVERCESDSKRLGALWSQECYRVTGDERGWKM